MTDTEWIALTQTIRWSMVVFALYWGYRLMRKQAWVFALLAFSGAIVFSIY
jgi:multisubunit Na+/H+ antiporter MnhF subunit